jgi:glutathione gamma-glutamylcysteinyltransferase
MVLVLDTARFKYPSYFVSVEKLYESLFPIDAETGSSRGYFLLSANPNQPAISLCKIPKSASSTLTKDMERLNLNNTGAAAAPTAEEVLRNANTVTAASPDNKASQATVLASTGITPASVTTAASICSSGAATLSNTTAHTIDNKMSWTSLAQTFCKDLPSRIQTENPQTLNQMISVVLQGVPREYAFWISQQQAHRLRDTTELIDSIRSTMLYSLVSSAFPAPLFAGEDPQSREARLARQQHEGALVFGTLFLMSSPSTLFLTLPSEVSREFEQLRKVALLESDDGEARVNEHRVLKEEVEKMRSGIVELVNSFCCCGTKTATTTPEGTA